MENIKRIDWIDALRGFAIILVLIGHIPGIPDWLFKWIYSFHIPLFFVISGFLFNKEKWESLGFKKFILSRLKLYIIPFVILSLSIFVAEILKLLIFSNVIYWEEFYKYVFDYLRWILFQIDGDFCGSWIAGLWFLPTLFISSIILFVINDNKLIKIIFCVVSSILIIIINHLSITIIPWHLDVALLGTMYMLFGYVLRKHSLLNIINKAHFVLIAFVVSNILITTNSLIDFKKHLYGNYFISICASLLIIFSLFYLFSKININNYLFKILGTNSLLIVSLNFIVNKLLDKLLSIVGVSISWLLYFTIELGIFYLLSKLNVMLMKKIKMKLV